MLLSCPGQPLTFYPVLSDSQVAVRKIEQDFTTPLISEPLYDFQMQE